MDEITFDLQKYQRLKKEYDKTLVSGKDSFFFEGRELLTSYAKYLLEYLKQKFDESTHKK